MGVFIVSGLIALLFSYLYSIGKCRSGLELAFFFIIAVACLRYDVGNDYWAYYYQYERTLYDYSIRQCIANLFIEEEQGWRILILLSKPLGWYSFVALITFFTQYSFYKFIKNNVPKVYTCLAVFIYLFSPMMYLLSLSMMRQALAMALFLCAYPKIVNRRIIPALLLCFIAYTIHQSAIILLPFAFIGLLPMKNGKVYAYIIALVFLVFFFNRTLLETVYTNLIMANEDLEHFDNYSVASGYYGRAVSIGLGTLLGMIPFSILLAYIKSSDTNENQRIGAVICAIGTLTIPFQTLVPMISRLMLYFSIFSLLLVPLSYDRIIKDSVIRNILFVIYIFTCLYGYIQFWSSSSVYYKYYLHYHTLFEIW